MRLASATASLVRYLVGFGAAPSPSEKLRAWMEAEQRATARFMACTAAVIVVALLLVYLM